MNKLLVDTQTYCTISSKLSALSSKLESLSAQLSSIDLSQEAGSTVQLTLSSIRFSLIGTSLADEIAELAIKRVARAASSTASEAAALRLRILSAVDMLESSEQELVAQISDLCTDASEWAQRQEGAGAASSWQSELDINVITKAFDLVRSPDGQPSITTAEKLRDDGRYQVLEGIYSAVTGDWSNMVQSDTTREQYLFDSLLQSCADPDFNSWSTEEATRYINDIRSLGGDALAEKIWKHFTGKDLNSFDTGLRLDLAADGVNEAVNCINQLRLLNSLDKSAALSMAQAYINSGNESMQEVGKTMTLLLNSDAATQFEYIWRSSTQSFCTGAVETASMSVIKLGLETCVKPVSVAHTLTTAGNDLFMNTSNNASLTNNLIYSAEAARTMYDAFQSDYAAYKADPSDANLERTMASYSAYNRAMSNSYEAYADYTANTTDSLAGKIFSSDAAKNVDEQARFISSNHLTMASDMDARRVTRPS